MTDVILNELLELVPVDWQARFRDIVGVTDAFCEKHLNEEYKGFCREMAVSLCQPDSPVNKGRVASWAAGIVYTIGWVNFLGDPTFGLYMRGEDIAKGIGVSVATMHNKAKMIRDKLRVVPSDPDWCLPSRQGQNPLVWLIEGPNGLVFDIRHTPREMQVKAYEQGLIPYVPADEERPEQG